jgi:His-Xaa-Ser system protein HxsD
MILELDGNAYCLEAVQKASYRFINKLTIQISTSTSSICCDIHMNDGKDIDIRLIDSFKRELLDQQLRVQIKKQTEDQRNLILAYAFSKTGLQE